MSRRTRASILAGVIFATTLFVAVQALLTALVDPVGFYAPDAQPVLPAGGSPAPGRGTLDAATVAALEASPLVEVAVPETFLYTVVRGEPTVVRGADLSRLLALHDAHVIEGERPPDNATALLVGEGLARRMGVQVGNELLVPASTGADLVKLRVDGLVAARTGLTDELLVDRATGDRLAGLPPGAAHFVEVRPVDPVAFDAWLTSTRDAPRLRVEAPIAARVNSEAEVRVLRPDGAPLANALLSRAESDAPSEEVLRTNWTGHARVPVTEGATSWRVTASGFADAQFVVRGVEPGAGILATRVQVEPDLPLPERPFRVLVHVQNFEDEPHEANVTLQLDGRTVRTLQASLDAGEAQVLDVELPGVDAGDHVVEAGDARVEFLVATPDSFEAQFRLAGDRALDSMTMRDALDDVFGSVVLAAVLLGTLAFLLFFVGNAALFARLVREREADLSLLRNLGASRMQVRAFALRALGPLAVAAAGAGLVAGAVAAEVYARSGVWTLFGHTLRITWSPHIVLLLTALALACTLGAVMLSVEAFLRRTSWAARTADQRAPPADLEELIAS